MMKKQRRNNKRGYISLLLILSTFIVATFYMMIITIVQDNSYKTNSSEMSETIRKEVLHRYNVDKDFKEECANNKLDGFNFEVKDDCLRYVNNIYIYNNIVSIDFMVDGDYYDFEFIKADNNKLKVNYAVKNGIEDNKEFVKEFFNI